MISEQLDAKKMRKNYYRNNFRKMVMVLMFFLVVIIFLILLNLYRFFTLPEPYYYATSSDGTLTQLLTVPRGTGLVERNQG